MVEGSMLCGSLVPSVSVSKDNGVSPASASATRAAKF